MNKNLMAAVVTGSDPDGQNNKVEVFAEENCLKFDTNIMSRCSINLPELSDNRIFMMEKDEIIDYLKQDPYHDYSGCYKDLDEFQTRFAISVGIYASRFKKTPKTFAEEVPSTSANNQQTAAPKKKQTTFAPASEKPSL